MLSGATLSSSIPVTVSFVEAVVIFAFIGCDSEKPVVSDWFKSLLFIGKRFDVCD